MVLLDDGLHHGADVRSGTDIRAVRVGAPAGSDDLPGDTLSGDTVDVADRYRRAPGAEFESRLLADAASCSRDQRDLVFHPGRSYQGRSCATSRGGVRGGPSAGIPKTMNPFLTTIAWGPGTVLFPWHRTSAGT